MVTLRRDVAAEANNRLFDDNYNAKKMTPYDQFIADKNKANRTSSSANFFGCTGYASYADRSATANRIQEREGDSEGYVSGSHTNGGFEFKFFGSHKSNYEEPKTQVSEELPTQEELVGMCANYNEYASAQINRKAPGVEFLSEAEFYELKFKLSEKNSLAQSPKSSVIPNGVKEAASKARLCKSSKLFIGFYVLIVLAVASIIVTVNSIKPELAAAEIEVDEYDDAAIESMDLDDEVKNDNWFDAFLDDLNK